MQRLLNYTISILIAFTLFTFVLWAFSSMDANAEMSVSTRIIQWAYHPSGNLKADSDPYGIEYRISYGNWFVSGTPQLQSDLEGHDVDLSGFGLGYALNPSRWLIFDIEPWIQAGYYSAAGHDLIGIEPGIDLSYLVWRGLLVFTGASYFWAGENDLSSIRLGYGLKYKF